MTFYAIALSVLSIPTYNLTTVNFRQFSLLYVLIAVIFIMATILSYNDNHLPNFLIIDVKTRLAKKPLFSPFLRSFVFFSSINLMYQQRGSRKALGILTWVLLFATSASTSRGSLVLAALVLYPIMPRHRFIRYLIIIALGGSLLLYSLFIIDLRGESQVHLASLDFSVFGYQPNKLAPLLFYLPSLFRGEWVSTNVVLSEMVMSRDQYSYIITFGDIANMMYGYGVFYPLVLAYYVTIISMLFTFIENNIPKLRYYFLGLLCLIGGRVGLESLIPQVYIILIVPFAFFGLLGLWRRAV